MGYVAFRCVCIVSGYCERFGTSTRNGRYSTMMRLVAFWTIEWMTPAARTVRHLVGPLHAQDGTAPVGT